MGGALFVVHALTRRQLAVASRRDRRVLVAFGVVGVGLFYSALPAAIEAGGVSLAWVLLYTAPAWVALLSVPVLGERLSSRMALLVVVTVAGVVAVSVGGGDGIRPDVAGIGWGLVSGLTYASWYLVGRGLSGRVGPVTIAAWSLGVGAVVLAPALRMPDDEGLWPVLLALGAVSTYLPALTYYAALRHLPAARAAVIATLEPVAALALAAAVFGERLAPLAIVGAVMVIGAALAASREEASDASVEPLVSADP